ncbi:HIG1 domain family member 2A, mitochondrial [Hyperolius riggenbachi]|uniref:HIG1 domain family member 2A, mitochondrial n=1 Tax=Hyperolius riggenbachi TaxID=752182 RepID=UPI0035A38FC8
MRIAVSYWCVARGACSNISGFVCPCQREIHSIMAQSGPPVIEGFTPTAHLQNEPSESKFMRKVKANPFVPLGCLATAGVLTWGLIAFKQGKRRQSQLLMRARIISQGFTLAAIMVGVVMAATKSKPSEN